MTYLHLYYPGILSASELHYNRMVPLAFREYPRPALLD